MSNDELLKDAFLATRAAEAALRQAVRIDLGRVYGPQWYSLVPDVLKTGWARAEEQDRETGMPSRNAELLDYATLDEVAGLINRFGESFELRFGKIALFQDRLNEFRRLRNALMHGVELPSESSHLLTLLATALKEQCLADVKSTAGLKEAPIKPVRRDGGRPAPPLNAEQSLLLKVVERATAQMSGKLFGEREALMDHLQKNRSRCSSAALSHLREKFAAMPDTESLADKLLGELAPPRPEQPKSSWDVAKWLNWASRSYMPYRRWLLRYGLTDAEVDDMALAFEDWLRLNYPDLLRGGHDALVVGMYKWVKQQLDSGMRVLWLVVDNLCGLWESDFIGVLADAGIQVRETRRMLALLPSTTAVSRRALLAGRLPREAMNFADDEAACRQLWHDQGVDDIAVCTSTPEVEQAIRKDIRLIILIDNYLDTLAHQADHPGFDRAEQMSLKMGSLAVGIGSLLHKISSVGPARLVIGTDHGATYPSPTSQIVAVPPSAVADDEAERHQRYSIIEDPSGLNSVDWHILAVDLYGLPWTCAIARGQRYLGRRPKAYTHGGLSPEETVVRLLIAEVGEREPLELVLTQATPPMRLGRSEPLAIIVRNPFEVPVEDLYLELILPNLQVQFDGLDVPPRSEAKTIEHTVTLPAKLDTQDGVGYLRVTGHYRIMGRPTIMPPQRLRVRVRELYRSSMDDFGDLLHD